MTLLAAVGQARALDGREAGLQAAHQRCSLGSTAPVLGIVISSYQYDAQGVVNGVASLIGDTPVIGFSTPAGLTSDGLRLHSIVLGLIAATDSPARKLPGWPAIPRAAAKYPAIGRLVKT